MYIFQIPIKIESPVKVKEEVIVVEKMFQQLMYETDFVQVYI